MLNELREDDSRNFRILVGPRGRGIGSDASRMAVLRRDWDAIHGPRV